MRRQGFFSLRLMMALLCVLSIGCGAPKVKAPDETDRARPAPAESGRIVSGGSHTCMITPDKTAECWGDNRYGQLGDGTTADAKAPVKVHRLSYVVALAAGEWHTCAVLATGPVKCWGDNTQWQLGMMSPPRSSMPVLTSVGPATTISAGGTHTCAILIDGEVVCWGDYRIGQTGVQGEPAAKPFLPVLVRGVVNAVSIAAGGEHSCAVQQDGQLLCWGDDHFGQLGRGIREDHSFPPRPVALAGRALSVAAGRRHTCALLEDRTVQCWGEGIDGQLGDGSQKDSPAPVRVVAPEPGGKTAPLEQVTAITAGSQHVCALLEDGKVYCWGSNALGQLGRAEGKTAARPVFSGLTGVVAVAAGGWHTCAIRADGTGVTTCVGEMKPSGAKAD